MALIGFQGGDTRPATLNQKKNKNQKNMKNIEYWMGFVDATSILIQKTIFKIEDEKDFDITVERHDEEQFKIVFTWIDSFVEETFKGNNECPPDGISPVYDGTVLYFNYNDNTDKVLSKIEDEMYKIYNMPIPELAEIEEFQDWER